MKRTDMLSKLKIGCWVTFCCELDLHQIETEEELQEIKEDLEDEEGFTVGVWNTEEEALKELTPTPKGLDKRV